MRGPGRSIARILVPALALSLLMPRTAALARVHVGPCDLTRRADESVASKMKRLIRCAAGKWEVRGGSRRAICVADAESHLNPMATSADGNHVGLFQHLAHAWPDRYDAWTRPRWELNTSALSGRTNAIVTIRMVNADGWGPWRGAGDCFDRGSRARESLG